MRQGSMSGDKHREATGGKTPSTAPNNAFEMEAGNEPTGFDSPPVTSSQLGNTDVDAQSSTDTADLNYPPGGGPDDDGPRGQSSTEDAHHTR